MADRQGHAVGRDAQPELDEKVVDGALRAFCLASDWPPDSRVRGGVKAALTYLLAAGGTGEREQQADGSVSHERRQADGTADPGVPQGDESATGGEWPVPLYICRACNWRMASEQEDLSCEQCGEPRSMVETVLVVPVEKWWLTDAEVAQERENYPYG